MDNTNYLTHHKPIPNDPTNDNKEAINITKKKNKDKNSKKGSLENGGTKKEMRLSTEPQSVAARERRHKISERFKILQSLVPCTNGTKMDTASMLEQAIQYVKFLKAQIWLHQAMFKFDHDHVISHHGHGHDHDHGVGSHHHHEYVSTEDNYDDDYLVMSQMYGHSACSYGDHDHQGEDAMSFDHTSDINGCPLGF